MLDMLPDGIAAEDTVVGLLPFAHSLRPAAIGLLLAACAAPETVASGTPTATASEGATADSIAGSYECGLNRDRAPDADPESFIVLRDDGTATIDIVEDPGPPSETTWSAEGDTGSLNPGTSEEDTFNIVEGNLIFGDPNLENRFACTPAG